MTEDTAAQLAMSAANDLGNVADDTDEITRQLQEIYKSIQEKGDDGKAGDQGDLQATDNEQQEINDVLNVEPVEDSQTVETVAVPDNFYSDLLQQETNQTVIGVLQCALLFAIIGLVLSVQLTKRLH